MEHHSPIRWYNPTLKHFEWREVPPADEQALEMLDGSSHSQTCTRTSASGAGWNLHRTSLMRAGEAAKDQSEDEKEGDDAR